MEVKEYLGQIRVLQFEIDSLLEQVSRLRNSLERCTTRITDEPRGGFGGDSLSSTVIKIIELERLIDSRIDTQIDLKREIIQEINQMPSSLHRTLLIHRYINCKSWRDITRILCYEESHIYRIHGSALIEFLNIKKDRS